MLKQRVVVLMLILAVLISACIQQNPATDNNTGGNETGGNQSNINASITTTKTYTVLIERLNFDPTEITVNVNDTVVWVNDDTIIHAIISTGKFESPGLRSNESWSFTFLYAGNYTYFDEGSFKKGKVIVNP